ncbi:MAG: tetratricopeptide repeat protein [Flavobacteriia bacterium]|nr:tetratricopeptide repeat protein [Flavobacteriia bacterium]
MKKFLLGIFAISTLSLSAQKGGSSYSDRIQEAIAHHDAGEYEKAIEIYDEMIDEFEGDMLLHYERGFSYSAMNNCEDAIEDFKLAIEYGNPTDERQVSTIRQSYIAYANCLDDIGNSRAAVQQYEDALETLGPDYLLYYNWGITLERLEELEEAEAKMLEALTLNPFHSSSMFRLSILQYNRGASDTKQLSNFLWMLLLEESPTRRSVANSGFDGAWESMVSGNESGGLNINISSDTDERDEAFQNSDFMLGLMYASLGTIDEKLDSVLNQEGAESAAHEFSENMETRADYIRALAMSLQGLEDADLGFYWNLITKIIVETKDSEHFVPFVYWVSQNYDEDADEWISENNAQVEAMAQWLSSRIQISMEEMQE